MRSNVRHTKIHKRLSRGCFFFTYRIGHTQIHGSFMLEDKVFIRKLFSVNGFSSSTIALSKVSSLPIITVVF